MAELPPLTALIHTTVLASGARLMCGTRGCVVRVGEIKSSDDYLHPDMRQFGTGTPREYFVEFLPGFERGIDGVFQLSRHQLRQWKQAKRRGINWAQFARRMPRSRLRIRGRTERAYETIRVRLTLQRPIAGGAPYQIAEFLCPVCQRRNLIKYPFPLLLLDPVTGSSRRRLRITNPGNSAEQH